MEQIEDPFDLENRFNFQGNEVMLSDAIIDRVDNEKKDADDRIQQLLTKLEQTEHKTYTQLTSLAPLAAYDWSPEVTPTHSPTQAVPEDSRFVPPSPAEKPRRSARKQRAKVFEESPKSTQKDGEVTPKKRGRKPKYASSQERNQKNQAKHRAKKRFADLAMEYELSRLGSSKQKAIDHYNAYLKENSPLSSNSL